MRLARRVGAIERSARALPPPEPFDLRALARVDPEVLNMLFELREWREQNPGRQPSTDPGCAARQREIARRWEERAKQLGRPIASADSAAG